LPLSHTTCFMWPSDDVYTVDEIARGAGVPRSAVETLVESGDLRPIGQTHLFTYPDAIRAGRQARLRVASGPTPPPSQLSLLLPRSWGASHEDRGLPAVGSSLLHVVALTLLVWSTSGAASTATSAPLPLARLVFWAGPGPGGGGGGGGRAPKIHTRRISARPPALSERSTTDAEPIPSHTIISPVATTAGDAQAQAAERNGQGTGSGPGLDKGFGGGTGGGPFRPGSGIDPPRLIHEVKAQYANEARQRGVTGNVLLEIVVRSDGTVGDIQITRGLGFGLDEQAASAVRSWRFAPATRFSEPVDVIVEVEVDFSLR
jgi:protein TonB